MSDPKMGPDERDGVENLPASGELRATPGDAIHVGDAAASSAETSVDGSTATATETPPHSPKRPSAAPSGRRYGFLCSYCSSRLEAVDSMAGEKGTCPTCGNMVVIPILDSRGRLIDPASGQVIKQDPHPVHAYAAAGHKAPKINIRADTGERLIECPRCGRFNKLAANNCEGCGLPFTMEGTVAELSMGGNSWAIASLILGIVSLVGGFLLVLPPILAIVFGVVALRVKQPGGGSPPGQGQAIAGLILGVLTFVLTGVVWARMF